MTQDEIIEMARQAGCPMADMMPMYFTDKQLLSMFEAFAKLVAEKKVEGMVMMTPDEFKSVWDKAQAEEREACAKAVEDLRDKSGVNEDGRAWLTRVTKSDCVKAIRARGQA